MTTLEKSLIECLDITKLPKLPKKWDGSRSWAKAIALVEKANGTHNYSLCRNSDGEPSVTKDFGLTAQIVAITEIYPYEFPEEPKKQTSKKQNK